MNELEKIGQNLAESVNLLVQLAANRETETEETKQKHYQDVVLANIDIKSKAISADKVLAWSGVTPQYFETHKPRLRNGKRTNTYWGVDVTKWLCDYWKRDYPDKYINECYIRGINTQTGEFMHK